MAGFPLPELPIVAVLNHDARLPTARAAHLAQRVVEEFGPKLGVLLCSAAV